MPPPITLKSPLPDADLLFESMTSSAALSSLGETQLNLLSTKPDLKPEDLLGKSVTVTAQLRDDAKRHFNGYVSRFGAGRHQGRYFAYQATVNPWLWFLTRTSDCRIFQDQTVPEIVKKVFEDHGIAKFEFKTFRTYRKWVYCVQYRESDFNFVARLLEHEGIYWYFEHDDGQHTLVLVDSQSAHDAAKSCESLPYVELGAETAPDTDYVSDWRFSQEVRTGKVALTSYDFERPSTDLKVDAKKERKYTMSDYEVFDFPGDYIQKSDGKQLAEDRMDELQTPFQALHGSSNAQGIDVGRLLKLTKHPRGDQNAQYLITSLHVSAHVDAYESGNAAGDFRCDFSAIPAAQQFRPTRRDAEADRPGAADGRRRRARAARRSTPTSTAASRCSSTGTARARRTRRARAGSACRSRGPARTGASSHIPRIGQEVIVDFLEGDPDRPIITGRVYNAEQMPPYDLPANKTQSGIKTRSSKGGGAANFNEIRFEDKKGSRAALHPRREEPGHRGRERRDPLGRPRPQEDDRPRRDDARQARPDRDRRQQRDDHDPRQPHRGGRQGRDDHHPRQNRTETVDKDENDHDPRQPHRDGRQGREDHDRRRPHRDRRQGRDDHDQRRAHRDRHQGREASRSTAAAPRPSPRTRRSRSTAAAPRPSPRTRPSPSMGAARRRWPRTKASRSAADAPRACRRTRASPSLEAAPSASARMTR